MIFILRLIIAPLALLFLSAVCCFCCLFRPFHQKNTFYYTSIICPSLLWILGVKSEVENQELIPSGVNRRPVVLMSNHQDNIDGLLVSKVFHWTYTIIGKKSIKYVPFFGWLYWLSGMVLIDRTKKRSAHQTMNQVENYLSENKYSLYLFPEGTRSKGKGLQSFKKGGFRIAINLQRDIIPVVINNYYDTLNLKKLVSARVTMRVLPAIPTKGYTLNDIEVVMEKVHKVFRENLKDMGQRKKTH